MPKAIVLGAGMVGSVMAADLVKDPAFSVAVADVRPESLRLASARAGGDITTIEANCADANVIRDLVKPYDIVLGALASHLGYMALKTVIEAGKNYCDIAFMAEDALDFSPLAEKRGVTAIVDCGVAPGMSNLLAAYGASQLESCEAVSIFVGGLPRERRWPFEYKAAFAPADVVEEYTRPARLVEHGKIVIKEALSEPELLNFPGVGTLEAFNTDGLRSLVRTLNVPHMREKTMRYPGHIEIMRVFRELGLFSEDEVTVKGVTIRPRDLTASLLFPKWTYAPGEEDLTVMRVTCEGKKFGRKHEISWDLFDTYDVSTQSTSMARTTAFPCTITARLLATGRISHPGVHAPEVLAKDDSLVEFMLEELQARGVRYSLSEEWA